MSKILSLKLREDIYEDTEKIRKQAKLPRNTYINRALEIFNKMQKRGRLKIQLQKESNMVSKESLSILAEFERMGKI